MEGYTAATYGDRWADGYDEFVASIRRLDTDRAVEALARLAGDGPVLELAVGTGRLAIPLTQRGLEVHGIDASPAMVKKLRAKPGGASLPVAVGDMADVEVEGTFSLVFVAFNTFFALLSQEEQVRCFRNVADHLTDDGVFVIEAFVPDPTRFARENQSLLTEHVGLDEVHLNASRHDPVRQTVTSSRVILRADETRILPVSLRYAWPSELDLMAQLAGLGLRDRFGDWDGSPFTARSGVHVSVYERDG